MVAQEIQRLGDRVNWPKERLEIKEQPDSSNGQFSDTILKGELLNQSARLLRGQVQDTMNGIGIGMRALAKRKRGPRMKRGRHGSGKGKGGGSGTSSKDGASKGKGGNSKKGMGMGKGGSNMGMSSKGMGKAGMGMGKGKAGMGMGMADPSPVQSPVESPVVSPSIPDMPSISTPCPSKAAVTLRPSKAAMTLSPSKAATTLSPSEVTTTLNPSEAATTLNPSEAATTLSPSEAATTLSPSEAAATDTPSVSTDTTERPSQGDAPPEDPPTDSPSKEPKDDDGGPTQAPKTDDDQPSPTKGPGTDDGGTTETPSAGEEVTESPSVAAGSVSPAPSYTPGTRCFPSDSDIVPCPNPELAAICDKYNPVALFSKCYADCVDAFCCIHDSEATRSPSCSKDVNCQFFKPCYIVWFKLHDTIGPAPFLRLKQNEAFYDINDDDFQKVIQDNAAFYDQFLGHHFLTDDLPLTDETFVNPANW